MVENSIALSVFENDTSPRSHGGCSSCGSGSAGDKSARCGEGLEKIYPTTAVRFGYMRYIGEFTHAPEMKFACGAKVVIQTKRGIELGEQVSLTCSGCDKSVTREEMKSWVELSGEDSYMFNAGRILREATAADLSEFAHIQVGSRAKRQLAQRIAEKNKLPLKVVECECPLGGERIIFFFTAGERVDFRGMVKELASEYRTRIEMRQIGARDEARLLADYETCGREVCCKVFLKSLKPISMRMAKLQKATLDPSQVSGRCGRLKCCLRYEHTAYEELDKQLPRIGVRIRTSHGVGVVINRQVLTQLIQMRSPSDSVITVVYEDITEVNIPESAMHEPAPETTKAREPSTRKAKKSPTPSDPSKAPERTDRKKRRRRPSAEKPAGETQADKAKNATGEEGQSSPTRRRRKRRRRRDRPSGEQSDRPKNDKPDNPGPKESSGD